MGDNLPAADEHAVITAILDGATVDQMIDRRGIEPRTIRAVIARHGLDITPDGTLAHPDAAAEWLLTMALHSDTPGVARTAARAREALTRLRSELIRLQAHRTADYTRAHQTEALRQFKGILRELIVEVDDEYNRVRRNSDEAIIRELHEMKAVPAPERRRTLSAARVAARRCAP